VLMKVVNGETQGMFILEAAPKELTIVLILGPIRMEDLGELKGIGGVGGALGGALGVVGPTGPLSGVQHTPKPNSKKGGTE
jgi:hypothetical protein